MPNTLLPSLFGKDAPTFPAFRSLQREIDRIFDEYRDVFPDMLRAEGLDKNGTLVPDIDIQETDETFELSAELPGVDEDDVDISVSGNLLTMRGKKTSKREESDEGYRLIERSYGHFSRTIPFPFDLDEANVKADFSKGVLSLTIEKPHDTVTRTRRIEISKTD